MYGGFAVQIFIKEIDFLKEIEVLITDKAV